MTGPFQARASMSVEDVESMFVPRRMGVGISDRETTDSNALLLIHMLGEWVNVDGDKATTGDETSMVITVDTERAVGLIVQLRQMLLEAGVPGGRIIAMMKEAYARIDAGARHGPSTRGTDMNFVCNPCATGNHDDCAGSEIRTYCDCQHRTSVIDPDQLGGPVVPVDGNDSIGTVPDDC